MMMAQQGLYGVTGHCVLQVLLGRVSTLRIRQSGGARRLFRNLGNSQCGVCKESREILESPWGCSQACGTAHNKTSSSPADVLRWIDRPSFSWPLSLGYGASRAFVHWLWYFRRTMANFLVARGVSQWWAVCATGDGLCRLARGTVPRSSM